MQSRLFSGGMRDPEPLTFLSNGGGQDSLAILLKLIHDQHFRNAYAPGRLISITADTGDEHRHTLYNLVRNRRLCREHGIEFYFITGSWGFHSDGWPSLPEFYARGNRIGSKSFPKSCTDNLKIKVIYRFLASYMAEHYGVSARKKDGFYEYAALSGQKITALIGISAEERHKRLKKDEQIPAWMKTTINRRYPLVEIGWDRGDCQDYIRSRHLPLPPPSLCRMCPYKTAEQVLLMSIEDRRAYDGWVRLERKKLDAHAGRFPHLPPEKNHGVFGANTTLPRVVADTREKFAHLTDDELHVLLHENRMNHGHCVASSY